MIGCCCHVTTIVATAPVVTVCCPEILMEVGVLLEFTFTTISILYRPLKFNLDKISRQVVDYQRHNRLVEKIYRWFTLLW